MEAFDHCVHERFQRQAGQTPEATAVASGSESLTYAELDARSNQLANCLRSQGVGPDARVGIWMTRSTDLIVCLLGILKSGGAYVPLDPEHPAGRIGEIIADSAPTVVLADHPMELPQGISVPVIRVRSDWQRRVAQWPRTALQSTAGRENLVYVIYTSGSTGRPKGILFTHGGLANAIDGMRKEFYVGPGDNVLQKSPSTFGVCAWEIFLPLGAGAKVVVAEPEGHRNVPYLKRTIGRERVTLVNFVPSMLQLFMDDAAAQDLSSLRAVLCAGEVLKKTLLEWFLRTFLHCKLYNLYGQTETEAVTGCRCEAQHLDGIAHIGRPRAGARLYVLDEELQPVPVGTTGRLYIGGPGLGRGYANLPELTAEQFIAHPFTLNTVERLYKTGDLVRFLPEGGLAYVGRVDHQVKLHGMRIELGEIEAVLASHPDVRLCSVVARDDINGSQRLVAYIVPMPLAREFAQWSTISDSWRDDTPIAMLTRHMDPKWDSFLTGKLPETLVPKTYVFMASFPLTSSGKIDRRALPPPSTHRPPLQQALELPSTDTQRRISAVWRELLQLDVVGIDDSFFELGGHSLLLLQTQIQLSRIFQRDISVVTLLQSPTVRALADRLDDLQSLKLDTQTPGMPGRTRRAQAVSLQKRRSAKTHSGHEIEP